MNVECTVAKIKKQLEQLPESLQTCDQLHQLETARSKSEGCSYRAGVKNMLIAMRKRIKKRSSKTGRKKRKDCRYKANGGAGRKDCRNKANGGAGRKDRHHKANGGAGRKDRRSKANGGAGRKDRRHKANGGAGRKDCRSKANGGAGRKDRRNVIRGGPGRPMKTGSVNPTESQSPREASQCNELRDFWWNHSSDAAVLASCCASHEAAMHTFWSVEEWMLHIASATTGVHTNLYKI